MDEQMARNLIDADDGFLRGKRYLILDRDPLYTKEYRQLLRGAGVKPLLLPARRAIGEYLVHYHGERNHQGFDNVLLKGAPTPANENGRVRRRERLGGLLNFYHRDAA